MDSASRWFTYAVLMGQSWRGLIRDFKQKWFDAECDPYGEDDGLETELAPPAFPCESCEFVATTLAGLRAHERHRHAVRPQVASPWHRLLLAVRHLLM
eukprot:5852206-Amphidinium_carterae.1